MTPRLPLPGFLGIGAMRCGTSWFATQLARHPALYLGRKEIHFFDRKLDGRIVPFLPAEMEARLRYRLRFLPALAGGRTPGEFTPSYAILERERIVLIRRWMPNVKLFYVMRDPVERAWSHAQHHYANFLHRDPSLASEAELRAFFERPPVRKRGDYATCLENWLAVFRREQFFLTFLEDIERDAAAVLRSAFRFLDIEPDIPLDASTTVPVHQSVRAPMPDGARAYLLETLRGDEARLEALLDRPLPWAASASASPPEATPGERA